MATKKKRVKTKTARRVVVKTSLAAADIWANNAALKAQQNRENDVLRAELRNQGLEQKLMLQSLKADVERDRIYYKRLADLGDARAAVALRDITENSQIRVAETRAASQSVSPEESDSTEAYDLAFSPYMTPVAGKRGDVHELIKRITRNSNETERRLPSPRLGTTASLAPSAAVVEQLGASRQPTMATATPSAVQIDMQSPNPFISPTPPRSRAGSQSQRNTPQQARLPPIGENPHAVSHKPAAAPSMNLFGAK